MKIYIIRHGETDSNKEKIIMGCRVDELLNTRGVEQVNKLADSINEGDFDVIFTSPLKRARQTAEIIANKINAPILERKEIIERDWGSVTGKRRDDAIEILINSKPDDVESTDRIKKRLMKFISEIKRDYFDKKVLIVAHGGILKVANLLFSEEKSDKIADNATIHEFNI